jgi:hypothetical protein
MNTLRLTSYFSYWDFAHSSLFCFGTCQTLDARIKVLVLMRFLSRNLESPGTAMNNSHLPKIGGLGPLMNGWRAKGA